MTDSQAELVGRLIGICQVIDWSADIQVTQGAYPTALSEVQRHQLKAVLADYHTSFHPATPLTHPQGYAA